MHHGILPALDISNALKASIFWLISFRRKNIMITFVKIIRALFGLYLLISSSTSFAVTFIYYFLNSEDSVKNPITITDGHIDTFDANGNSTCNVTKSFSDIKITTGQEQIFSYNTDDFPASCYTPLYTELYVTTVDGKSINQTCKFPFGYSGAQNPSDVIFVGTIKITETNDRFFCEFPVGASKKK
jgi:hypothetical protein